MEGIIRHLQSVEQILNVVLLAASTLILIFGGAKLSAVVKSYKTKYLTAVYGFYSKLEALCIRLKITLVRLDGTENGKSVQSGYYISYELNGSSDSKRLQAYYYCEEIKRIADNVLNLLSSENDQIVPFNIFEEWKEQISTLIHDINDCKYIDKIPLEERKPFVEKLLRQKENDGILEYFIDEVSTLQRNVEKDMYPVRATIKKFMKDKNSQQIKMED